MRIFTIVKEPKQASSNKPVQDVALHQEPVKNKGRYKWAGAVIMVLLVVYPDLIEDIHFIE